MGFASGTSGGMITQWTAIVVDASGRRRRSRIDDATYSVVDGKSHNRIKTIILLYFKRMI